MVLKTDVQGSLGAIRHALERLNTSEVRINILREGAGDINESDVQLASASDAVVIGFNTKPDPGRSAPIDASGVDVRIYDVIYKLTDDVGRRCRACSPPSWWSRSRVTPRCGWSSRPAGPATSPART